MSLNSTAWFRFALCTLLAATSACAADTDEEDLATEGLTENEVEPIIGGVQATSFPEAVLIDMTRGGRVVSACSGSMIAPRVVLTAGHCVAGFDGWIVRAPFAGNQRSQTSRSAVFDYTSQNQFREPTQHDVAVILLDTPINLAQYPSIAKNKLADGTQVVNIGRKQDGQLSSTALFMSTPLGVRDGRSSGFPFDYVSVERIEPGDSGGPDMLNGTHTIVAVNSAGGGGTAILARVDLLADFIQRNIAANGGAGNTFPDATSGGGATTPSAPQQPAPQQPQAPGAVRESEPNNGVNSADALGSAAQGAVTGSDQDWFSWTIDGQQPYQVKLTPTGDAQLNMFKLVNGQFFRVPNSTPTSFSHTASGAGTYFVAVFSPAGQQQSYTLTLAR
jgi:V8-like Glu-specific endopeptidase